MDKTPTASQKRVFLIEALPEPLTRASAHIQLFDNYLLDTDLRLRSIRDPETRGWRHSLQKRPGSGGDAPAADFSEIVLSDAERERFEIFDGSEIRKNRYYHEIDGRMWDFDVYLGKLWGLNTAIARDGTSGIPIPPFAIFDVTSDHFFGGSTLVRQDFETLQKHLSDVGESLRVVHDLAGDE